MFLALLLLFLVGELLFVSAQYNRTLVRSRSKYKFIYSLIYMLRSPWKQQYISHFKYFYTQCPWQICALSRKSAKVFADFLVQILVDFRRCVTRWAGVGGSAGGSCVVLYFLPSCSGMVVVGCGGERGRRTAGRYMFARTVSSTP